MLLLAYSLQETTVGIAQQNLSGDGVGLNALFTLLSGFVGALLVFVLGAVRDLFARRRERIALMTLIHYEVMQNEKAIQSVETERPDDLSNPSITDFMAGLHDDAWKENRDRITQLEDNRAVELLGSYYASIATLIRAAYLVRDTNSRHNMDDFQEILSATIDNLGPVARYVCERQTDDIKVWSKGMLLSVGKWQKVEEIEEDWKSRKKDWRRIVLRAVSDFIGR